MKMWGMIIFLSVCGTAMAQLKWDKLELEFHPSVEEEKTIADFTFKNEGDHPITIQSANTSCGCTVATPDKKTYSPGEEGKITAIFTHGNRTGTQEKVIVVQTDDSKNPTTALKLRVFILEPVKMNPAFVFWVKGEEKTTKTIQIKIEKGIDAKVLKARSNQEKFLVELQEITPNEEYAVQVTPTDTETTNAGVAMLTIETNYPVSRPKSLVAYAQVKEDPAQRAKISVPIQSKSISASAPPQNVSVPTPTPTPSP